MSLTPDKILAQSFLNSSIISTEAAVGQLAAGQPVTLTMTFLPPLNEILGTPLFSASVTWSIYSDSGRTNPMIEGEDYLVLSDGGLTGQLLTLVFKPPMPASPPTTTTVYIRAKAVATAMTPGTSPPIPPPFVATTCSQNYDIKYTVSSIENTALNNLIQQLFDQLYVAVPQLLVHPGDLVTARVALRKAPGQPQLVTSLLDEMPNVEVRGSIPLDNILNYILEPFRKITSLVPSSNPLSKADDAVANIKKILPSALTLPLRLDIRGQRLTTAFAPIGDKMPISFSRTPDESGDIQGFLPLGQWPLPFSIPNTPVVNPPPLPTQAGIQWEVSYDGSTQNNGLTNNLLMGTLNNIVLPPPTHPLGVLPPPAASPAVITIKPFLSIYGAIQPLPVNARFPSIALEVLPLYVPEIVVVFGDSPNSSNSKVTAGVHVSSETGALAGSLDELLQLLGNLSTVLNGLISTLSTTSAGFDYTYLIYLNRSIKAMSEALTQPSVDSISFVIADPTNVLNVCIPAGVSSFFAITPRSILLSTDVIDPTKPQPPPDTDYLITLTDTEPPAFLSSYILSLIGRFSEVSVTPLNSIRASNPAETYYHRIQFIQFGTPVTPPPDQNN